MSKQSILVTSATGNQGRGVVSHCLASTSSIVYAFVREPTSTASLDLQSLGAVLVKGDLNDAATLYDAIQQIQPTSIFLNLPPGPPEELLTQAHNVVTAAKETVSIKNVIYSSSFLTGSHETFPGWGPDYPSYDYWLTKDKIEKLIRDAEFPSWVIVRLPSFLQMFVPPLSTLLFPELWASPDGKRLLRTAFEPHAKFEVVDAGDIGAVVAAALNSPERFYGKVIELAVESLTIHELAEKLGCARGVDVEVICESSDEVAKRLGPRGPRLVISQVLLSQIPTHIDVQRSREEFKLTEIEEFFAKANI